MTWQFSRCSNAPVVEDNVWQPDDVTGNAKRLDPSEVVWIPRELLVVPFLERRDAIETLGVTVQTNSPAGGSSFTEMAQLNWQ